MSPRYLRRFVGRFVFAVVVATVVSALTLVLINYRVQASIASIPRLDIKTDKVLGPGKPANYLVIGSDTRAFVSDSTDEQAFGAANEQTGQRSDTMMIVHVEPQTKRTLVVSIPRDTWVTIPGIGQYKINAAFNKDLGGGPAKVVETIKANFNIPIHHYVEVDFASFQGIVDALGSVPVYFPAPTRDQVTGLDVPNAGCQKLQGDMALAYVRSRHYEEKVNGRWQTDPTADLGRIKRQQSFMRRVASEAVRNGINNPLVAKKIADKTLKNLKVDDNFETEDVYRLLNSFRNVDPNDTDRIRMQTLPGEGAMRNGQSVLILKQPEANAVLASLREFNTVPASPNDVEAASVRVRVVNASGKSGIASTVLADLQKYGFSGAGTGNATARQQQTEIRFLPGAEAKAAYVARAIPGAAAPVVDGTIDGADVVVIVGKGFTAVVDPAQTPTTPTTAAGSGAGASTTAPADPAASC